MVCKTVYQLWTQISATKPYKIQGTIKLNIFTFRIIKKISLSNIASWREEMENLNNNPPANAVNPKISFLIKILYSLFTSSF